MTSEEFRQAGHALIEWIAAYREGLEGLPVRAQTGPGAVRAGLPAAPPETGGAFEGFLADLDAHVLPGTTHWQHPSFFAYFPGNASLASVLGDLASSGLGAVGLSWEAAPALTEVEETMVDWVRQIVGLSGAWRGVIQDTASTSTLVALITARERTSDYALARTGLAGSGAPLTVYAAEHSHSSVEKAALLAGFGREHLRFVSTDDAHAMDPAALADAVRRDVAAGAIPCAVVATTGTTTTTALDPVDEIAAVAVEHDMWLHVDAAMAGGAMVDPALRWMWEGVERADSVVLNAHKWWGAVFDCSVYLVRDPEHLVRVMSTDPSYLRSAADDRVTNFRDWGIPLGRRFRALKLWALLRDQGVEGLRARVQRDLMNATWLAERVASAPHWKVLAPVPLQTVCVRHEPPGLSADALDRHTLDWVEELNASGRAFLTPATLDGRWMVRVSIGAEGTERAHVEALWRDMRTFAEGRGA